MNTEQTEVCSEVRLYNDPALITPATYVDNVTDKEVRLAQRLEFVLGKCFGGAALAANQIGDSTSMFAYKTMDAGKVQVMINPRVVAASDETWMFKEGCLSFPGTFFYISRPREVDVVSIDLDGNETLTTHTDFFGRVMQHEIDHLEGRVFIDLAPKSHRKKALRELGEKFSIAHQ